MGGRSHLYVPADQPTKLDGALGRGADSLIFDLEDAVPPAAKATARAALSHWLARQPSRRAGEDVATELWVRVNPAGADLRPPADDIVAAVSPAVTGIVVAKCESAAALVELDHALAEAEAAAGLPTGHLRVAPLVETARGVAALHPIAACPRVARLQIGEVDLAADLGMSPDPEGSELVPIRVGFVVASAAAGLEAPVGPVYTDLSDLDGLRRTTEQLRRLGFGGRAVIHPRQLEIVNDVFTPTEADVASAHRVLESLAVASAGGRGTALTAEGRFVDEAVVRSARAVLAQARRAPVSGPQESR